MTRLVLTVTIVVAAVLLLTEMSMQPSGHDRLALAVVYGIAALITLGVFMLGRMADQRIRSMATSLQVVAIASVGVAGIAVVLAAQTMFISPHDRNLVFAALLLGVGLGSSLAIAFGERIASDLAKVGRAVSELTEGDLSARASVGRRDEVGRLAAAFDRMAARLDATERERSLMIASIGHDLRTPLASLRATIEAMQDGVVPTDARTFEGMQRDVTHLSRLVEDLFLYARTESGTIDLHLEDVDLAELADETAEVFDRLAAGRGVHVVAVGGASVPAVADPWAMGRVLRNLVDNAVRHSPAGGSVRVVVGADGDGPTVTVEDDGPGFAPDIRDTAFERFTRGDSARTRNGEGAGLGLAIARGLVEAQGGHISIVEGDGGRVRITL